MPHLSRASLLLIALPTLAGAMPTASASLQGRVQDESGKPVANAVVVLSNRLSGYKQSVKSDDKGRFSLHNIPPNDYHLEVGAPGFQDLHREVELRTPLPVDLTLSLKSAGATVVVEENLSLVEDHASVHLDIDKSTIQLSPAPVQSRAMESILLTTPGFVPDENGRFHFKGSHGQVMYVVDGVPITDQMQLTFSNSLDPAQVESMEVITGGVSAEYGGKPVGVVNVTSRSGLGTPGGFEGEASLGSSRFNTLEVNAGVRGGGDYFGYFLTAAGSKSDRFADPVNFDNLHNHGETNRLFSRFDWVLSESDTLRMSLSGGSTDRQIVNLQSQQDRGQNQRSKAADFNASFAWTHLFDASRSLDASVYLRQSRARLLPSDSLAPGFASGAVRDFPFWAEQDRTLDNQGLQVAYTQRIGEHTLKAGLQYVSYPIHERFRFAVVDGADPEFNDPASPFYAYTPTGGGKIFTYDERIRPTLASAYVQNDLHFKAFFLSAGLRWDTYTQRGLTQVQLQPRVGASYRFDEGTVLRASFDRLLVTPENENLALSTSQQAWDLGPGRGTAAPSLPGELQNSTSFGVEQQVGKTARITLEYWQKDSKNTADNEQFFNTGVLFPVAAAKGIFHGFNARVDLTPVKSFSAYLSFGRTRAIFQAPLTGGLQIETPSALPGERFLADHDQKLAIQMGLRWQQEGRYAQLVGRYDSGLVAGDPAGAAGNPDLAFGANYVRFDSADQVWRVKPRTTWDLSLGDEWKLDAKRRVGLGVNVLNLTNEKGLYNFLSVFGGTHVLPPRTLSAHLSVKF